MYLPCTLLLWNLFTKPHFTIHVVVPPLLTNSPRWSGAINKVKVLWRILSSWINTMATEENGPLTLSMHGGMKRAFPEIWACSQCVWRHDWQELGGRFHVRNPSRNGRWIYTHYSCYQRSKGPSWHPLVRERSIENQINQVYQTYFTRHFITCSSDQSKKIMSLVLFSLRVSLAYSS